MTYFTALDVFLRSVSICIMDDKGNILLEDKVASEVDEIIHCINTFNNSIRSVGFEVGALTQYLTYGFQAAGFEVVCLEARQVSAALSAMRNKTDKNDARGIAHILRTGWYNRVHVKSFESHITRALLTSRKTVLKKCIDLENEIRGLVRLVGIKLPGTLKHGIFDSTIRDIVTKNPILADKKR